MTNPHSPIVDFYPPGFEMDMEGKRAEWEAIVLIPFINQQRLLAAEATIPSGSLTEAERSRNQPGSILIFSHDAEAINGAPPASPRLQALLQPGLPIEQLTCEAVIRQSESRPPALRFVDIFACFCTSRKHAADVTWHAVQKPAHARCADPASATDCTSTLPSHFASIARCNSRMQRSPPPAPLPPGQPGFTPTLVTPQRAHALTP